MNFLAKNDNNIVNDIIHYTQKQNNNTFNLKIFFITVFFIFQIIFFILFYLLIGKINEKDKQIEKLNDKIFNLLIDTSFIDVGNNSSAGNDLNNNININGGGKNEN